MTYSDWVKPGNGATLSELRAVLCACPSAKPARDHLCTLAGEVGWEARSNLLLRGTGPAGPYTVERIAFVEVVPC